MSGVIEHPLVLRLTGIAIVFAVWEVVGALLGPALFAPLSVVVPTFIAFLFDGEMLAKLAGSMRHMAVGYVGACLVGMPLGAAMGRSKIVDLIAHPWISMLVVSSVAALVPIFMLIFGTGIEMRMAIVFVATIGYVTLTAYHGARGIDPKMVEVARSFGTGRIARFRKVIMPSLFPYLITGAQLGLIHAIRAMVVAEMFVIVGYGGLIFDTGLSISTAPLMAYLVMLMIVSIGLTSVLRLAGRRVAPWYEAKLSAG